MKLYLRYLSLLAGIISASCAVAQPITGVWKGKIDRQHVELKIIKKGDSLTGTSYYYQSPNRYVRFSIKGYFDELDNSVIWWDDQLIEEKNNNKFLAVKNASPYRSNADFNCPGGTKMYLTGKAALKGDDDVPLRPVDLQKFSDPVFNDEWDFVIENYTRGASNPDVIDSIGRLAFVKPVTVAPEPIEIVQAQPTTKPIPKTVTQQSNRKVFIPAPAKPPVVQPSVEKSKEPVIVAVPLTNEQKFASRDKKIVQEIPISGDSIELRFYDNAIVDGDSIAIFLNSQLMAEHILLTEHPYTIKLAVATLQETNELVMVAENLGTIPPNTSLMIAYVDGKRYEARLESTEQSSAVIRFVRRKE